MSLQLALVGTLHRLADAARQMDIGGVDHDSVVPLLDVHDPVEGVLLALGLLLVAGELQNLILQPRQPGARQTDDPGRIFVIDPVAGLASDLHGGRGTIAPGPAPAVVDRAALRTDRGFAGLMRPAIGIDDVVLLGRVPSAVDWRGPLRAMYRVSS